MDTETRIIYWTLRSISYFILLVSLGGFVIGFMSPVVSRLIGLLSITIGLGTFLILFSISTILYKVQYIITNEIPGRNDNSTS